MSLIVSWWTTLLLPWQEPNHDCCRDLIYLLLQPQLWEIQRCCVIMHWNSERCHFQWHCGVCHHVPECWQTAVCVIVEFVTVQLCVLPSVLWHCWLGGKKGIWPVKNLSGGVLVPLSVWRGADLHMAQLMPLPLTVSCFSKIQIGFTFLVLADPCSPGKRAVKRVCVCQLCVKQTSVSVVPLWCLLYYSLLMYLYVGKLLLVSLSQFMQY